MMNFFSKNLKIGLFSLIILSIAFISGCGKDDPDPDPVADPIASFLYEIDTENYLQVAFDNKSQNATSYSWDFGDGNTSADENPIHTYAAAGEYTVVLSAKNADDVTKTKSATFSLEDPNQALKKLTGDVSKTWRLYREGVSMSLGPDAENAGQWWGGLENDGSRPCLYEQEFTFGLDGSYTFDDKGMFWAEYGIFNNVAGCDQNITAEACVEATAENLKNACGDDVSAWSSGTHSFTYDPASGELTLTGEGAYIGIPKLGTTGEIIVPGSTVTCKVSIEEKTGYDVMLVEFIWDGSYWPIYYASYSDAGLEPEIVYDIAAWGEDLDDISPTELSHSFDTDFVLLDTIMSGSTIVYGVDDPAGGSNKVGQFNRTATDWQELQFQTSPVKNDINFSNLTTLSLDVYLPSTNDYSGSLAKTLVLGFGDRSATEQWWTNHMEYTANGADLPLDTWTTITYQLNSPDNVGNPDNGATPYDRTDLDMFYIGFGGGGHSTEATFFVRNLEIK